MLLSTKHRFTSPIFGIITSSHFIYFNKLRDESFNNLLRSTVIKMHIWNQDQVYNSSTELQVDTTVANTLAI